MLDKDAKILVASRQLLSMSGSESLTAYLGQHLLSELAALLTHRCMFDQEGFKASIARAHSYSNLGTAPF